MQVRIRPNQAEASKRTNQKRDVLSLIFTPKVKNISTGAPFCRVVAGRIACVKMIDFNAFTHYCGLRDNPGSEKLERQFLLTLAVKKQTLRIVKRLRDLRQIGVVRYVGRAAKWRGRSLSRCPELWVRRDMEEK